jgi:hypothetical protein
MWVITKEDLILIGLVAAAVIVGLLVAFQPRSVSQVPEPIPASAPAASTAAPEVTASTEETSGAAAQVETPSVVIEPTPEPAKAVDGVIYADEYDHITSAGGFQICWSNDDTFLHVGLVSPGIGYLAIGFDPDDRMRGANIIIGAVTADGLVIRDDYANGPVQHNADTVLGGTSDIVAAAGTEQNGKTYLEFVIPLDSGDSFDKRLVPGETYDILIAFHETNDDFNTWHSRRGTGSLRLDP